MTALNRRAFLGHGIAIASVAAMPRLARAQDGPFTLPDLPYAFDALTPVIDARTMELHHDKHHAGYVRKLNAALADHGQAAGLPLHELLARLADMPDGVRTALRNNGGGHANHSMFWSLMSPAPGAASDTLNAAIDRDLGGIEAMKSAFEAAGAGRFGSGWVMVTVDEAGKLGITSTPNQDTPLMQGDRVLLGNDVWEHAYYLNYQNRRGDYLKAWWDVLDWAAVSARYDAALSGTLTI